jgi:hypothetical protein
MGDEANHASRDSVKKQFAYGIGEGFGTFGDVDRTLT